MSMNISKGNMYEFITNTWNTVKGHCPHECAYCYMRRWGPQRPVRLDRRELSTDLGTENFIFVGSSCDMFAANIPREWIGETLRHCEKFFSRFFFQSKNPENMATFAPDLRRLVRTPAVCTTIETNRMYHRFMGYTPNPGDRVDGMASMRGFLRYVTIEPIIDFDMEHLVEFIKRCEPVQVNIGADSGRNGLPEPPMDKVLELADRLKQFTTIAKKRNLDRLVGGRDL